MTENATPDVTPKLVFKICDRKFVFLSVSVHDKHTRDLSPALMGLFQLHQITIFNHYAFVSVKCTDLWHHDFVFTWTDFPCIILKELHLTYNDFPLSHYQ